MAAKKKIRAGVIGLGVGQFHVQGYTMHPDAEVTAVCDLKKDLADRTAAQYGIPNVYLDYKEMLRSGAIDAVSVCVPNDLHRVMAIDSLQAGLNVLCEKPMTTSAREGKRMFDAAQASDKVFMMQFNNRYRPDSQFLKQAIAEGELGDIYFARCGWIRRNGIPGWGSWFTDVERAGGGPLIDLAVHMLDLTIYLMGNPEPVTCLASTYSAFGHKMEGLGPWGTPDLKGKFTVEDMAVGMIKFDGGQTIWVEASWASRIKEEYVFSTLCGTKAGANLETSFGPGGGDRLEMFTQERGVPVDRHVLVEPDPAMGRTNAVQHFCDCIVTGKKPISPAEDGYRLMRVLDAMYKSAKTGKAVNIA